MATPIISLAPLPTGRLVLVGRRGPVSGAARQEQEDDNAKHKKSLPQKD